MLTGTRFRIGRECGLFSSDSGCGFAPSPSAPTPFAIFPTFAHPQCSEGHSWLSDQPSRMLCLAVEPTILYGGISTLASIDFWARDGGQSLPPCLAAAWHLMSNLREGGRSSARQISKMQRLSFSVGGIFYPSGGSRLRPDIMMISNDARWLRLDALAMTSCSCIS